MATAALPSTRFVRRRRRAIPGWWIGVAATLLANVLVIWALAALSHPPDPVQPPLAVRHITTVEPPPEPDEPSRCRRSICRPPRCLPISHCQRSPLTV